MVTFVTGASGFLGSHIAEQLAAAGRPVRALVRRTSDTRFLKKLSNVELIDGSIDDRSSFERALSGVDAVIHVAGLVRARNEEEFQRVNTRGTAELVDAAVRSGSVRRFVYVSSLTVAGPSPDGRPVSDDIEPRPLTAYGRSKLAAERAVLERGQELEVVIVRPPAIYGPRDREILAFFRSMKMGVLPMISDPQNKMSMIYGPDCAAACVAAIDAELTSGTCLFVDDGTVHTFEELVVTAEAALGRRAFFRLRLPERLVRTAALGSELLGRVRGRAVMFNRDKCNELLAQWVCDGARAQKLLGWRPEVSFSEGVQRTVDWYRQAGWL